MSRRSRRSGISYLKDLFILFLFVWIIRATSPASDDVAYILFASADIYMCLTVVEAVRGFNFLPQWGFVILGETILAITVLYNPIMMGGFGIWHSTPVVYGVLAGVRVIPAVLIILSL